MAEERPVIITIAQGNHSVRFEGDEDAALRALDLMNDLFATRGVRDGLGRLADTIQDLPDGVTVTGGDVRPAAAGRGDARFWKLFGGLTFFLLLMYGLFAAIATLAKR